GRFSSTQTLACDSGMVEVTAVFANTVAFAAGDTVEVEAASCRFGAVLFGGRMAMRVISASGYPGTSAAWSARASVDYVDWRTETVTLPLLARVVHGPVVLVACRLDAVVSRIALDIPALMVKPVAYCVR